MFEFAWPAIVLLLPLPWLFRRLLPAARRPGRALHIPFMSRLEKLEQSPQQNYQAGYRLMPLLFIWLLLLAAAAKPQWLGAPLPASSSGRDMMLAIDLSASMDTRDLTLDGQPNDRLSVVKHWLKQLIAQREGDRLGLILFGSRAYVQSPLTYDLNSLQQWLDEAFIGLAGRDTAIGDAIGLAIKRLMDQPASSRVLLLITDGANTAGAISPVQAAQVAAEQGIRIFTLGVGAETSGAADLLSLLEGRSDPASDLDEATLKDIAALTQGRYFRVADSAALESVLTQIEQLEPSTYSGPRSRLAQPLYHWPLAAAVLLSLGYAGQSLRRRLYAS